MHIEFRHLRTIKAIHEEGGLARAAERLHITQSALSHQIKGLEDQAGVELFVRRSRPMRLSAAGMRLLAAGGGCAAEARRAGGGVRGAAVGQVRAAAYRDRMPCLFRLAVAGAGGVPQVPGRRWMSISGPGCSSRRCRRCCGRRWTWCVLGPRGPAGRRFHAALSITSRCFVCPPTIRWRQKAWIEAEDFADQHLITYPVERARLDVFSQLLFPAGVEPRSIRQVELSAVMLLLVASGRGVAVLPDWVVRDPRTPASIVTRPLTEGGITRRLYGATRADDTGKPFMSHVLKLCRTEPPKLQRRAAAE
jgi:LysR family transcriptional regulator for metE and metH